LSRSIPLSALAVDVAPHRQFLRPVFVLGDQPWAERAEGVVRLALGPLAERSIWKLRSNVVADAIAGDVVERVGLGDIFGAGADDGGDFDFPSRALVERAASRRCRWARSRGVGFQEKIGSVGICEPVLGVIAVIRPWRRI